jgi:hypothetical protein
MRKLVIASTLLLGLTGLLVAFALVPESRGGAKVFVVLAHIWLGVAYLVVFPLYAWDHIRHNRRWLRVFRAVTASGLLQLGSGAVALLTGLVLLAYGGASLWGLREVHHWITYPLLAGLAWHYFWPKRWRPAANREAAKTPTPSGP